MYIPKYYQVTDLKQIRTFIESYPFATIITTDDTNKPVATHVPVNIIEKNNTLYIYHE